MIKMTEFQKKLESFKKDMEKQSETIDRKDISDNLMNVVSGITDSYYCNYYLDEEHEGINYTVFKMFDNVFWPKDNWQPEAKKMWHDIYRFLKGEDK